MIPIKRRMKVMGMFIAALLTAEGVSSVFLDSTPSVIRVDNTTVYDKAIVVLGGAGMPQELIDPHVKKTLLAEGDYFEFVYSQEAFEKDVIVRNVLSQLTGYSDVTFYVLSMGGMIAHDVIHEARKRGDGRHFNLIMIDSPSKGGDVDLPVWNPTEPLAKLAACLPFGVATNRWVTAPAIKGDLSQAHPRDPEELKALWKKYGEYNWPGISAQGCYVFRHAPLRRLTGVTAVYIRSTKDTFVKDSALEGWKRVVHLPESHVLHVNANHISLMDEPSAYEYATAKALDIVS